MLKQPRPENRPWRQPVQRLTPDGYRAVIESWKEKHPAILSCELKGKSAEKLPIHLLKITDPTVPDDQKYILLLTALHSGSERSGTAGLLAAVDWLLGESPGAVAARRSHIILAMPICNPGGYFLRDGTEGMMNAERIDVYTGTEYPPDCPTHSHWDVREMRLIEPERAPEIAAFMSVVDEYRPEVHFDLHGVTLEYAGQIIQPSLGSAGSNYSLRPWDGRFLDDIIARMNARGQSCYCMERDAQRLFAGEQMQPRSERFWDGKALFYTSMYAYLKYHTLPMTAEVPWNEYALAAVQSLVELGVERGYPVDLIKPMFGGFGIASGGHTPGERRASRAELWQNQERLAVGFLYPCTDGRELLVGAVNSKANALLRRCMTPLAPGQGLAVDVQKLLAELETIPDMSVATLRGFIADGPTEQRKMACAPAQESGADFILQGGLTLEFRLYSPDVKTEMLTLNGMPLVLENGDYEKNARDGGTGIRVHIPKEKIPDHGLFIIACAYTPSVRHTYGWPAPDRRNSPAETRDRNGPARLF